MQRCKVCCERYQGDSQTQKKDRVRQMIESNIIIRKAEPRDLGAIQELQIETELLILGRPVDTEEFLQAISGPPGFIGVAEVDGRVIGFIYGEKLVGNWVHAPFFAITKDFRGTNVYRQLGQWFLDHCKAIGAKKILAYADIDKPKLVNFYRRFGFVAGDTLVEMVKEI